MSNITTIVSTALLAAAAGTGVSLMTVPKGIPVSAEVRGRTITHADTRDKVYFYDTTKVPPGTEILSCVIIGGKIILIDTLRSGYSGKQVLFTKLQVMECK